MPSWIVVEQMESTAERIIHTVELSCSLEETSFLLSQGYSGQFIKCARLFTSSIWKEQSHLNVAKTNI
jgi:hypothetical protein